MGDRARSTTTSRTTGSCSSNWPATSCPTPTTQTRIATGFLRVGTFDDEPNDPLKYKFEQLDDLIHATSTAFLAVTLKCARCHDHKFDPIPQTDYYAVLNFFVGGKAAEGPLLAYTDAGPQPPAVQLLQGGDPTHPGQTVPPGFLSMVPSVRTRRSSRRRTTPRPRGRRTQLARWITDPAQSADGAGDGQPPVAASFWRRPGADARQFRLAGQRRRRIPNCSTGWPAEFVDGGWRLKRLHKLIMLSSAYQMDSTHPREAEYCGDRFRQRAVVASRIAGGWRPSRCATRCWPSAAN